MATRPSLPFTLNIVGDGSDRVVVLNMTTGPVRYDPGLAPTFNSTPVDVGFLSIGGPTAVGIASHVYAAGVLTITLDDDPQDGGVYTIAGTALY